MRVTAHFVWLLGIGLLALCMAYSALVLHSATWEEVRALDLIFPFYGQPIRLFSPSEYATFRDAMTLAALGMGGLLGGLCFFQVFRAEVRALCVEIASGIRALLSSFSILTKPQKRLIWGAFALLTVLRLYFSLYNPEYDDAVSYEVFVSKGFLATNAYYPIPNNHIFSNSISLLFYQLSPGFWWTMRLPVLLISTGTTIFLFLGVLRLTSFRVAGIATGLFSCLQLSLYHAGVGRGYWLMILLAGVVFFSTLILVEGQGRQRAAVTVLVLAGVVGCYTVPPFVYVLASAFSWLGVTALRRRDWSPLVPIAAAGILILAGVAVLYSPLIFVSGLNKLVGNGYVASLPPAKFWAGLPAYVWFNEGFMAGQRTLGAFITVPTLGAVAWLFFAARHGQLPLVLTQRLWRVGVPALWFAGLPYAVILVQRVFPPERVLLYKAFFSLILLALVVDWICWRWPSRRLQWSISVCAGLFITYQTYSVIRVNPAARGSNAAYHDGLHWLATQAPGPVLIPEPTHNLFFRFYAHSEMRQRTWHIDNDQKDTTRYAYVVAFPKKRGFFQPEFSFPPAYQNREVEIYRVPKEYPLQTKPWRH
ncbi:hypothetical protein I2I05_16100 [Hymenobacter sp. BT683]|uniref:Glycosyltransferase RgtA/B/C/D-like domain-containing protein n=1 Tax=Hymenobacter jeongseonensis TaxID=2791027 RepID=A0ABS0IKM3_9BACT|nr:hypothetical protein [Hymenobacter jeongseonensis]MBF9238927.1 hypothetical protein [Hymenobacter jeongseonensis]